MAMMPCEKCGEMVDEARAFCPACGHAFVREEQRAEKSNFDRMDNTVQMGNTMYNQMLSDMGLNISRAPNTPHPEKRVEVIAPVATTPRQRSAPSTEPVAAPSGTSRAAKEGKLIIWLVVGVLLLIFGLALLVVLAAFLIYWLPAAR